MLNATAPSACRAGITAAACGGERLVLLGAAVRGTIRATIVGAQPNQRLKLTAPASDGAA